jgi:hypothetical protein
MSATGDFGKMVPGFDFLQGLMKTAGSALPSMGQWVAPTLDPDELNKRIEELRTVQFWLEQNARMIATTIQALEVQRMTLSALKTMNLPVADLGESFKLRTPPAAERSAPAPAPEPEATPKTRNKPAGARKPAAGPVTEGAGMVDPMQWWGALTQQFTEIAAKAVKDSGVDAAKGMAGAIGQQAVEAAGQALKAASELPAQALRQAGKATGVPARKPTRSSAARKR